MRAGETKVDCKDAADETSTAVDRRIANGPRTGLAKAKKTLSWIAGLPSPIPSSPRPANIMDPIVTNMYTETIVMTVSTAARPGVELASSASSLTVSDTSQPQ